MLFYYIGILYSLEIKGHSALSAGPGCCPELEVEE